MGCCQVLLMLTLLHTGVVSFPMFQAEIPNGEFVPHPCLVNNIWRGVGHLNPLGGGNRNPFGLAFDANGRVWNKTLCELDSDGDGVTNGVELGDPDCIWKKGDVAQEILRLSHPGVCEPIEDENCKAKNWDIDCNVQEFTCDAVNDEDVLTATYEFERWPVPPVDTTYVCQAFELPSDADYHMIAAEPIVDNVNVVHHIMMYAVPDHLVQQLYPPFQNGSFCTMAFLTHNDLMMVWSVGLTGECYREEYGVPIGTSGFKYMILEKHWTNPLEIEGLTDKSGVKIYYTPKLRKYERSAMAVTPLMLELPPHMPAVTQYGSCSAQCTEKLFKEPYFITKVYPHMHYLGRSMSVEVVRDGVVVEVLVDIEDYSYDQAEIKRYNPPIKVLPGDAIHVKCTYDTSNRDRVIFFGDSSFAEEMCVGFIDYYPKQHEISICAGENDISWCGGPINAYMDSGKHQDCLSELVELVFGVGEERTKWYNTVNGICDPTGKECWPGCKEAVAKVEEHPCFHPDIDQVIENNVVRRKILPHDFLFMMVSCKYGQDSCGMHTNGVWKAGIADISGGSSLDDTPYVPLLWEWGDKIYLPTTISLNNTNTNRVINSQGGK